MMTDTQAMQAILKRIGDFKDMPKEHIQTDNQPFFEGAPFSPPKDDIWAQVSISGAGRFIREISNTPSTRTTGIIFIQLFAPLNTGTINVSNMADKWANHLQFFTSGNLEIREASIIHPRNNPDFYQVNINISYVIN